MTRLTELVVEGSHPRQGIGPHRLSPATFVPQTSPWQQSAAGAVTIADRVCRTTSAPLTWPGLTPSWL